jgi:predicted dehydrogenase
MHSSDLQILPRRHLLKTGSQELAAAMMAGPVLAQMPPPGEAGIGRVENGKVGFPNWKGAADKPSAPPPAPLPDAQKVGFAIVGLGRLSLEQLLPAFGETAKAKIAGLVSGTPEKARAVAAQYGVPDDAIYGYDEMDRMADNPDIKVVYAVTPNGLHLRDIRAAAAAGKHVLCEKPMVTSPDEARAMVAACQDAKVKLMVAYRCQYEPHDRHAVRLVRQGEHGVSKLIAAVNTQVQGTPDQWRFKKALAGSGALPDIGIYCLNAARFHTGEEPVEVFGRIFSPPGDPRYAEVEETVAFMLRFPSGLIASCSASYGAHESKDMAIRLSDGWIALPDAFAYVGQQLKVARRSGDNEAVAEIRIDHMASCAIGDLRPHTPGEEGLQDHLVMEAVYRSAETAQPVALPAVEGRDVTRGPAPKEG